MLNNWEHRHVSAVMIVNDYLITSKNHILRGQKPGASCRRCHMTPVLSPSIFSNTELCHCCYEMWNLCGLDAGGERCASGII